MHHVSFSQAIQAFDQANAQDPNSVRWQGTDWPKELLYAHRMSECLESFEPDATEALRLAVRCQHIRRWEIPRSSYPDGKKGYYAWRNELKRFHGEAAAEILTSVGYDDEMVAKVQKLLNKEQLKKNPDTQTLEDVICLVFLQYYLGEFAEQHADEKVVDILRKTWRKMSLKGQERAKTIAFPSPLGQLVIAAISAPS
ncbi:DUF4202 domain-containing protein [Pontibacter sp. G13]|uniref:DUF4202 domain-containing protein n=1 Tax=Pontibacter sp. G13 TaxID=3074898 RepID=UPI002889ACBD|nr:DUF4202 domain-containing protein [Pontibacter sp. G13]WNJ17841.1 DUF4202 domain-containing protein [Pontibacter sp. G13]